MNSKSKEFKFSKNSYAPSRMQMPSIYSTISTYKTCLYLQNTLQKTTFGVLRLCICSLISLKMKRNSTSYCKAIHLSFYQEDPSSLVPKQHHSLYLQHLRLGRNQYMVQTMKLKKMSTIKTQNVIEKTSINSLS